MKAEQIQPGEIYVVGDRWTWDNATVRARLDRPVERRDVLNTGTGLRLFRAEAVLLHNGRRTHARGAYLAAHYGIDEPDDVALGRLLAPVAELDAAVDALNRRYEADRAQRLAQRLANEEESGWASTVGGLACARCGAFVKDFSGETINRDRHDRWHAALADLLAGPRAAAG